MFQSMLVYLFMLLSYTTTI